MKPAQRSLRCPTCRNDVDVLQLEMRSADAGDGGPPRPKRMRSFEPETQPGARVFESLQAFLEAMRDSEAPEVAEKAGEALARWGVAEQQQQQQEEEGGGRTRRRGRAAYPIVAGHATVPEGVTRIGEDAFRDCSSLTSVTIPSSVTEIGGCLPPSHRRSGSSRRRSTSRRR